MQFFASEMFKSVCDNIHMIETKNSVHFIKYNKKYKAYAFNIHLFENHFIFSMEISRLVCMVYVCALWHAYPRWNPPSFEHGVKTRLF